MRRKSLWKKIAYIGAAVMLAMTMPTASAIRDVVAFAEDVSGDNEDETTEEEKKKEKETETQPSQSEPETPTEPDTGDQPPQSEPETSPTESETVDTETETEPESDSNPESDSEAESDSNSESGSESDSNSENGSEPGSESNSESDSESESDSNSESNSESESESESETESESESETESESESEEEEDHSVLNANWKTNIIASNASYLGQLSSAYGVSVSENFGSVMDGVEQLFAERLTDPQNFQASNWKDVFAVYIYELKQQYGSAQASSDTANQLLDVFTRMNAPESALGLAPQQVDIAEVFVEEYSIDEELQQIDEQQEMYTSLWAEMPNAMGDFAVMQIEQEAQAARETQYEQQKAQMEKARYEKWLRLTQEQQLQEEKKTDTYSSADVTPRTIADYVKMNGLSAAQQAEIEGYADTEFLQLCAIASAAPQIVRASVGDDVSEERVQIVTAAYSLVGKVGYFWGGKSSAIGWDPAWGSPAKVTSEGSSSSGMTRSYGLDCSGYVQWCFRNGLNGSDAGIGGHTTSQWLASEMVDQADVQPGDLVFYGGPERGSNNHIGVVVGKSNDGGIIVAHCSSSRNGVVVGEAWTSGFRYVRTVASLK